MATRFDLVTLDAANTDELAVFWCAALQLEESEREDGDRWIVLSDRDGVRRIGLQRGEARAGSIHLDLECSITDFEAELARLVSIGASQDAPVRIEPYGSIANLRDPEGNPFDLCAYG